MSFSLVQSKQGTQVTSGSTISAAYTSPITAGSILLAVVASATTGVSNGQGPATIASIADGTNKWKQAHQQSDLTTTGIDVWICEAPIVGSTPTVTATLDGFPPNAISGMNLYLFEYAGATGFQLVDAFGVAKFTTGATTTPATNYATTAQHELMISVVTGAGLSAATKPAAWNSRIADTVQGAWIIDNLDSGTSLAVESAAWTALTGQSSGCAVILTLAPSGVAATAPRIVQVHHEEPANYGGPKSISHTSQPFPVTPTTGSTLIAAIQLASFGPTIIPGAGSLQSVIDNTGKSWTKIAEQGNDLRAGGNWGIFVCNNAPAGVSTVTFTGDIPTATYIVILVELAGCPPWLSLDAFGNFIYSDLGSNSTSSPVLAGDIAICATSVVIPRNWVPGSGWVQLFSDCNGSGYSQMQLGTAAGTLTATWGTASNGSASVIAGMKQSVSIGAR